MIAYLVLTWLDWLGRLTPPAKHCPDFIEHDESDWPDYLDNPDAIECGRMYVEHCYKLKARR